MVAPTFTGRYASVRRDLYKRVATARFNPNGKNYVGDRTYTTEEGFRKALLADFNAKMQYLDAIEGWPAPSAVKFVVNKPESGRERDAYFTCFYDDAFTWRQEDFWFKIPKTTDFGKYPAIFAAGAAKSKGMGRILLDARIKGKNTYEGAILGKGKPVLPRFNPVAGMNDINRAMEVLGYTVEYTVNNPRYDSDWFIYTRKGRR